MPCLSLAARNPHAEPSKGLDLQVSIFPPSKQEAEVCLGAWRLSQGAGWRAQDQLPGADALPMEGTEQPRSSQVPLPGGTHGPLPPSLCPSLPGFKQPPIPSQAPSYQSSKFPAHFASYLNNHCPPFSKLPVLGTQQPPRQHFSKHSPGPLTAGREKLYREREM